MDLSASLYLADGFEWVATHRPKFIFTDADKKNYSRLIEIAESYGGEVISYYAPIVPDSKHPATKSVEAVERIMRAVSHDTIVDPFMGSGTVGLAALRCGKRFIGIDNVPKWVSLAHERIRSENPQASVDLILR